MSSLWTPGGEHPVDRPPPASGGGPAPTTDPRLDDEIAAVLPDGVSLDDLTLEQRVRAEQMVREMGEAREQLIATPASTIVVNHAMGLYELAAIHLSQQTPDFGQVALAIDALAAIVERLDGRLDEAEPTLKEALTQLRLTYVQLRGARDDADRSSASGTD